MKTPLVTACIALALTALAGVAIANQHKGEGAGKRGHHGPKFPIVIAELEARQAQRFDLLDADNDELVTQAEFEAGPDRFAKPGPHHRGGPRHAMGKGGASKERRKAMRGEVQAEVFRILDTNADGSLSSEEHAAKDRSTMKLAHKRAAFARLDANQDGVLTEAELPSRAARMKQADADNNGEVSRAEMRAWRQAKRAAASDNG